MSEQGENGSVAGDVVVQTVSFESILLDFIHEVCGFVNALEEKYQTTVSSINRQKTELITILQEFIHKYQDKMRAERELASQRETQYRDSLRSSTQIVTCYRNFERNLSLQLMYRNLIFFGFIFVLISYSMFPSNVKTRLEKL